MPGPAAYLGALHVCPAVTVIVPHVGGPVIGSAAKVLVGGSLPAGVVGDMAVCIGPPDTVAVGCPTVLAQDKPWATVGDSCAHGGVIVLGWPTVLVGTG